MLNYRWIYLLSFTFVWIYGRNRHVPHIYIQHGIIIFWQSVNIMHVAWIREILDCSKNSLSIAQRINASFSTLFVVLAARVFAILIGGGLGELTQGQMGSGCVIVMYAEWFIIHPSAEYGGNCVAMPPDSYGQWRSSSLAVIHALQRHLSYKSTCHLNGRIIAHCLIHWGPHYSSRIKKY